MALHLTLLADQLAATHAAFIEMHQIVIKHFSMCCTVMQKQRRRQQKLGLRACTSVPLSRAGALPAQASLPPMVRRRQRRVGQVHDLQRRRHRQTLRGSLLGSRTPLQAARTAAAAL